MLKAQELPEAIEWHEGMLLAPQHFQQLALRQEELLSYHAHAIAPYHWGVQQVNVDRVLLVSGTFRVLNLEAVMPDGLIVAHDARYGEILELDLTTSLEEMRERPLTIHVAVPVRRAGGNGTVSRYLSLEGDPVADETTGDGEIRIPRKRPRLLLVAGDRAPDKYITVPIARVRFQNDGYLMTEYVPPSLSVRPGSPIAQICSAVVRQLREKASFLAEQVRSPSVTSDSPQAFIKRQQIHSMVGAVPQLEAVLHTESAHPFSLYVAFCALAGQLASVGHSLVPPVFQPYDHEDPYGSFHHIRTYVQRVLDEGVQETHQVHVFQRRGNVFYLPFQEAWRGRDLVLGVRARTGMTEKDVVRWVKNCIIGCESQITSLRQRRILGVARRQVEESHGLVPGRGRLLFQVDSSAPYLIDDEKLLVMRFDDSPDPEHPSEIVLFVRSELPGTANA